MSVKNTKLKKRKQYVNFALLSFSRQHYNDQQVKLLQELAKKDPLGCFMYEGPFPLNNYERFRTAIEEMTSEANKRNSWYIKHKYDYAWIKRAIDWRTIRNYDKYMDVSNPKFVKFLKMMGFPRVPDDKTLAKFYNKAERGDGYTPPWRYTDGCGVYEEGRRNMIAAKFIEMMNAI